MHNEITRQISYVMVWHNDNKDHFHAPYPGHPSAPDFLEFYNNPYILFVSNINNYE
jgi:mannan endo-1,4-beta-mannosidase